jgi:hypothetical protein
VRLLFLFALMLFSVHFNSALYSQNKVGLCSKSESRIWRLRERGCVVDSKSRVKFRSRNRTATALEAAAAVHSSSSPASQKACSASHASNVTTRAHPFISR